MPPQRRHFAAPCWRRQRWQTPRFTRSCGKTFLSTSGWTAPLSSSGICSGHQKFFFSSLGVFFFLEPISRRCCCSVVPRGKRPRFFCGVRALSSCSMLIWRASSKTNKGAPLLCVHCLAPLARHQRRANQRLARTETPIPIGTAGTNVAGADGPERESESRFLSSPSAQQHRYASHLRIRGFQKRHKRQWGCSSFQSVRGHVDEERNR